MAQKTTNSTQPNITTTIKTKVFWVNIIKRIVSIKFMQDKFREYQMRRFLAGLKMPIPAQACIESKWQEKRTATDASSFRSSGLFSISILIFQAVHRDPAHQLGKKIRGFLRQDFAA
jgi:hypothetical protein